MQSKMGKRNFQLLNDKAVFGDMAECLFLDEKEVRAEYLESDEDLLDQDIAQCFHELTKLDRVFDDCEHLAAPLLSKNWNIGDRVENPDDYDRGGDLK